MSLLAEAPGGIEGEGTKGSARVGTVWAFKSDVGLVGWRIFGGRKEGV